MTKIMNEFQAKEKDTSLAVGSNGIVFDLPLKNIKELHVHYKDGIFHYVTGDKQAWILDGFGTGDTIPIGDSRETVSTQSTTRTFMGRMSGRLRKINTRALYKASNEYEAALMTGRGNTRAVCEKYSRLFNVKPNTVAVWMCKVRKMRI